MVVTKSHPNMTLFHMEAVDRIGSIPIIETGLKRVERVYGQIKANNRFFNWYLETAEFTLFAAIETVQPAMRLLTGPLRRMDQVLCKSLDVIEQRAPSFYLPPEMMYWNTKEYMSRHIVKPVIKRADSVKQIGNAVLESSITTYAADRIDGAFTAADKYVDKYLTIQGDMSQVDGAKKPDYEDDTIPEDENNEKSAMKAIHHGQRFSRKLKRRLTQRTLIEARALKKQSKDAINVLIYAAQLIVKDPKQAYEKATELWNYLSKDEPENQARPQTLEQLIVLLTRESARRVVHLVNFTTYAASTLPKNIKHSSNELLHQFIDISNRLAKIMKLDILKVKTSEESQKVINSASGFYAFIQHQAAISLENIAVFLSGRSVPKEAAIPQQTSTSSNLPTTSRRQRVRQNHLATNLQRNINGVC